MEGELNYLLQFRKLFTGLNQSFGMEVKAGLQEQTRLRGTAQ